MTDAPKILVADDDPSIRSLLTVVCRRLGCVCETVTDGAEAIEKIRSETYDVLLLDLMMPNVNGYQVIAAVRELPRKPAVIVVTAQIPKQTAGVEADVVHAIVQKPFDLNVLGSFMIDIAQAMYAERTKGPPRDIRGT